MFLLYLNKVYVRMVSFGFIWEGGWEGGTPIWKGRWCLLENVNKTLNWKKKTNLVMAPALFDP